ncbi:hatching enzyme 1.2-like [Leptopilina boulardi]|uniref:hatching enzyme 1.2-like n=1 Tax=Leptopilina boulardi TaxID=63433 RepID=UPI0021F66231|nr:hatching enzyme 1.2-like [Leptopilina boulardi]
MFILFILPYCFFVSALPQDEFIFEVPNEIHPVVPDIAKISSEDLKILQNSDQDPEVRPGLFEGDIAMSNEYYNHWRIGLRWDVFPEKIWEKRTVPYVISPLYKPSDYVTIYKALTYLNYMTCVKFIPWNGEAKDFVVIWPIKYPQGCWSYVGKTGGVQILSLQPPDEKGPNCLGTEGKAVHELMHALGIFHEQSRADRDKFVKVNFNNIISRFKGNFAKHSATNTTYNYEYDYDSIMHYGSHYFSKSKRKPTLEPLRSGVKLTGQRKAMTKTDCLKVNELYGCLQKPSLARRYHHLCQTLGI